MRLEGAILHAHGHVAQADGVGLFFEPDQRLAIEPHFDAIAQAGAQGGLEGESPFGSVGVGPRLSSLSLTWSALTGTVCVLLLTSGRSGSACKRLS
jgi:hypothetical protein